MRLPFHSVLLFELFPLLVFIPKVFLQWSFLFDWLDAFFHEGFQSWLWQPSRHLDSGLQFLLIQPSNQKSAVYQISSTPCTQYFINSVIQTHLPSFEFSFVNPQPWPQGGGESLADEYDITIWIGYRGRFVTTQLLSTPCTKKGQEQSFWQLGTKYRGKDWGLELVLFSL